MVSLYTGLKFLHVLAAVAWVGGALMTSILTLRLARTRDSTALRVFAAQNAFLGRAIFGPAAMLTLLAGIGTTAIGGLSFGLLWITWGFVGIAASIVLGAVLIRRASVQLGELLTEPQPAPAYVHALQRRLALLNGINTLILISVVGTMVFKPIL